MSKDCRSQNQADDMGFPSADYSFPSDGDTFTGKLVFKKWSKQPSLICYFDTDNSEKLKLCVWFSGNDKYTYRPKKSDVNMKEVDVNTKWKVTYLITKSGKTMWLTADELIMKESNLSMRMEVK